MLGVNMECCGMVDTDMPAWCEWLKRHLRSHAIVLPMVAGEVNFAHNGLTSKGVDELLSTLIACGIRVEVLKFHHNYIRDASAIRVFIVYGKGYLRELHLSHNFLGTSCAAKIVITASITCKDSGEYAYPNCGGKVPLWLRLEQNQVHNETFVQLVDAGQRGIGRTGQLVCRVDGNTGCTPHCCRVFYKAPAVHITYIQIQRPWFWGWGPAIISGQRPYWSNAASHRLGLPA